MKYYELACTRMGENLSSVQAWAKGESEIGINDPIFICEK